MFRELHNYVDFFFRYQNSLLFVEIFNTTGV